MPVYICADHLHLFAWSCEPKKIGFIGLVIYRSLIDGGLSFMKLPLSPGRAQGFRRVEVALVATCETFMSQPAFDIHFRTGDGNGLWALALPF